jgi:hypothetical protein
LSGTQQVPTKHLAKENGRHDTSAVTWCFCRVSPDQALSKEFLHFFGKMLCRVPLAWHSIGKEFFYIFFKNPLLSVH